MALPPPEARSPGPAIAGTGFRSWERILCGYLTVLLLLIGPFSASLAALDTLQVSSPDPFLDPSRWTTFDTGSGLAGRVHELIEDRDGYLWFATDGGAQRYDGTHWRTYTTQDGLVDDAVLQVLQAQDGAMWFFTPKGLSRFDGHTWTTHGVETLYPGLEEAIAWGDVLQARDGTLWVGIDVLGAGTADLVRYNGTAWEPVAGPGGAGIPDINCLYQTADGAVWVTTVASGVLRFDGHTWTGYTQADGLASNSVGNMLETADGTLWFACKEEGISRFDGTSWQTYTHPDSLPSEPADLVVFRHVFGQVSGLPLWGVRTRQGAVWFVEWGLGGSGKKVLRFDPHAGATAYTHPHRLSGGYEADDGSVWFHTAREFSRDFVEEWMLKGQIPLEITDRAVRYKEGVWTGYGAADGFLEGAVFDMKRTADGALWFVGTHQGQGAAARFDGHRWTIYTPQDGLIDRSYIWLWGLFPPVLTEGHDGTLWCVGQHEGRAAVGRFDGATWTRYTQADGLVGDWAHLAYEATDGTVWVATIDNGHSGLGLFRFDGQTWRHHTKADGLSSGYITGITEWPAGTLWVGTDAGISRLALSAPPEKATWWNKTDFPVHLPKVRSFLPTPDALWFAFLPNRGGGVGRYDGQTWALFSSQDGLVGDAIASLFQAADGALWFAGQEGLTRFDGTTWSRYTPADGLDLGWLAPTLHQMRDGSFWIDDSWGKVFHFRPSLGRDPPETELVAPIERVSSVGNIRLQWAGRDAWEDTHPQDLEFQWRLDAQPWSPWSGRTDVTFTELSSGSHRFAVRARDRHGNIDPSPATHPFVVDPPWWQNPWMLAAFTLLLGLAAVQTVRVVLRDRHLRQSNQALRTEMAERARLDTQLQQLHYLQRLRTALESTGSAGAMIEATGQVLMDVLGTSPGTGIRIQHDGHIWAFGSPVPADQTPYTRPLIWAGKERGHLALSSSIVLNAPQERALLDETAAQLSRALEARELERQLLQSARLVALGQMAAGVAHELNQPLSVISTTAGDIYQRHLEGLALPPERLQAMMVDILEVVDRLEGIIDHLRLFSRDTSEEPEVSFSVNETVHASLKLIGTQLKNHGIAVALDLSDDLPLVSGHPQRLEQVFLNLFANARDALDEKEKRGAASGKKQLAIRSWYETGEALPVLVEVEDNGTGMDDETCAHLFEPFFTTKEASRGTGLGLSISYAIVQDYHGTITCQSRMGVGTTFRLALPERLNRGDDGGVEPSGNGFDGFA